MAAVLASVPVFGFGLPCAYPTWYFADHGEVWSFLGFPTYGEGPFTDIGIETTTALLVRSWSCARRNWSSVGCCGRAGAPQS
jgi:hypothetical protein